VRAVRLETRALLSKTSRSINLTLGAVDVSNDTPRGDPVNAELTRRSFIFRTGAAAASASALFGAVQASAARAAVDGLTGRSTVVVRWSAATLEAIRETHPGPPMVARALAMVHTSIFDAWAAYDADAVGTRLGGSLRRPAEERTHDNKREALSYAAYRTLVDLYPGATQVAQFDSLMRELGYDPSNASTDKTTPSGIGNTAAAALLDFRHGDGSNQLGGYADTSGYVPVNDSTNINDPNKWQPLRPAGASADQRYIAPHWGGVTPFALTSGGQFRPSSGPPRWATACTASRPRRCSSTQRSSTTSRRSSPSTGPTARPPSSRPVIGASSPSTSPSATPTA